MIITLEKISEIVAEVREKEFELLDPNDKFEDLGIDSLGLLMVIIGIAQEYDIEGTEEKVVELVNRIKTVKEIIEYGRSADHSE